MLTPTDLKLTCLDKLYAYKSSTLIKDAFQYSIQDEFDASINELILNQLITSFDLKTNKINTGLILTMNSSSPKTIFNQTFGLEATSTQYLTSMFNKVSRYVRWINYRQPLILIHLPTCQNFIMFTWLRFMNSIDRLPPESFLPNADLAFTPNLFQLLQTYSFSIYIQP